MVTVIVGSKTSGQKCCVVTLTEAADEPRVVDFDLPNELTPLLRGQPNWANYVKGVVQHYRGNLLLSFLPIWQKREVMRKCTFSLPLARNVTLGAHAENSSLD